MLSKALEMRGLGLSVHWLHEKEKRPVGSAWSAKKRQSVELLEKGYKDGFNVGFMPGEKSSVPVSVIDEDHPFGEDVDHYWQVVDVDFNVVTDEGKREVTEHILRLFGADWKKRLPIVQSGSGGPSMHVYFLSPEPLKSHLLVHSDRKTTVTKSGKSRHVYEWEIELYGTGKNLVLPPSIHPDTGREYRWVNPIGEDLQPYIHQLPDSGNREDDDIFRTPGTGANSNATSDAGRHESADGAVESGKISEELLNLFDESSQRSILLSEEIIEECLSYIHNEDCHYDEWLRMGMALHAATEGAPEGYEWWLSWSESSSKHDTAQMKMKWKSFKDGLAEGITAATLKWWAKENGWIGDSPHVIEKLSVITSWQEGVALIANATADDSQAEVLMKKLRERSKELLGDTVSLATIKSTIKKYIKNSNSEDFFGAGWFEGWTFVREHQLFIHEDGREYDKDQFNNWMEELTTGSIYSAFTDEIPPYRMFLRTEGADKTEGRVFLPGGKRLEFFEGKECINTWRDTMASPDMDTDASEGQPFVDHVMKLIPDETDAKNLLDYLAFLVQKPGHKCMWWPLLVGGEGNGKSVVSFVMKAIIGGRNTAMPTNENLKEKFMDWAASAQLVLIEELWSTEKLDTVEKLKPFINDVITIRPFREKTYRIPARMNIIANSNHEDNALPLAQGNRRWYVIQTNNDLCPKSVDGQERKAVSEYHQRFWDWLRDGGRKEISQKRVEQICALLEERDISKFVKEVATRVAPTTEAGTNMARRTSNAEVQCLFDAIEEEVAPFTNAIVTNIQVREYIRENTRKTTINGQPVVKAMKQAGFVQIENHDKTNRFNYYGKVTLWVVPNCGISFGDVADPDRGSEVGKEFLAALGEKDALQDFNSEDIRSELVRKFGHMKAVK